MSSPTQELEKLLTERKRGVKESVYNGRLVDLIYQGADVNKPFKSMQSVKTAVGRPTLLGTLIKHGANMSPPVGADHDNVLMVAVKERNLPAVEAILKHARINVNYRNLEHQTASMLAAVEGDLDILQALVKAGADVWKVDDQGYNTLHYAARSKAPELIPYLVLDLKMNPNKKTRRGDTPLMVAVDAYMDGENSYNLKTVREIAKVSDLHVKNNRGQTIFDAIDEDWDYAPEEAQRLKDEIRKALKTELDSRLKTIYHVVRNINQTVAPEDRIELPDDIVTKIASINLDKVQASQVLADKFARRSELQKRLR